MDWFSSHVVFVLFILSFLTYSLPNKNFLYGFSYTYGVTRKALKKRVSGSSQRKTTKVRKRKMKKCEIALTLTAVAEWETQKYVEMRFADPSPVSALPSLGLAPRPSPLRSA